VICAARKMAGLTCSRRDQGHLLELKLASICALEYEDFWKVIIKIFPGSSGSSN
jgi:hypothetical protein